MKAVSPDVLKALGGTTTWKNLTRLQLATDIYIYIYRTYNYILYDVLFLPFCSSAIVMV